MRNSHAKTVMRAAIVVVLVGVAALFGLLATGAVAFGHGGGDVSGKAQTRHHLWASPRSSSHVKAAVIARRSSDGVTWTASNYRNNTGACVEIAGASASGSGSVGGCGITRATSYGIGGLDVGGTYYRIVYGRAPAGAAAIRVNLVGGSEAPTVARFAGRGIWFAVYPAAVGDASFDVEQVSLLDSSGSVLDRGRLPRISAYERAAQSTRQ
jgi:hypothetical protein